MRGYIASCRNRQSVRTRSRSSKPYDQGQPPQATADSFHGAPPAVRRVSRWLRDLTTIVRPPLAGGAIIHSGPLLAGTSDGFLETSVSLDIYPRTQVDSSADYRTVITGLTIPRNAPDAISWCRNWDNASTSSCAGTICAQIPRCVSNLLPTRYRDPGYLLNARAMWLCLNR
ncbi:hypothetical protein BDW22DRAFT_1485656, partial [Trametopsis cervina]